jgi:maltose O-acetyltransferase
MTELEKCTAGEIYNCHDPVFLEFKKTTRSLLARYNAFAYDQKAEKREVLEQLFGTIGTNGERSVIGAAK